MSAAMKERKDDQATASRRRFARRSVHLLARLRVGGRDLPAVIENLSPGGAFLRVALPAAADEVLASIGLPHGRDVHVRGKVRWRRAGPAPGVGIQFDTFLAGAHELR